MSSFWQIFWLELTAFVRSRALALLTGASLLWMALAPHLLRGDGTVAGAHEIFVRYSLGGVFALVLVTLLASATGSVARERELRRLQLTIVRPVRLSVLALGKTSAYVAVGAFVLALSAGALLWRVDRTMPCHHVLSPVLPSPAEEARAMYDAYMRDPATPAEVKRAPKAVVLRLLAQRAADHYQTIPTNEAVSWRFPAWNASAGDPSVRLRFTNAYEMRQDVVGTFRFGAYGAVVSNQTQAVLTIPLRGTGATFPRDGRMTFRNDGNSALMLRPRKDVAVLMPGDSFLANLVRAYAELVSVLALVVAFGVFLGAALGRPVALFTAGVMLLVSEMSPSVIEQYPDELEKNRLDAIGLACTRAAAELTHPVSALDPLGKLAVGDCVEPREVLRVVVTDALLLPLLLALASGFAMPRKAAP